MVWEAHKTVIRGILIKHGSIQKKKREKQTRDLLEEIQVLEMQHKKTHLPSAGRDLGHLRRQLTEILSFKAKDIIQQGKKAKITNWGTNVVDFLRGKLRKKIEQHIYHK